MDDSAEYRHVKRRRYITVALSVSLTTVLCVGYVVADIFDKLPGVLTLQEVEHATARTPGNAIAAATMVIPGGAGSMRLMLMGYYYPVIGAIKNLINALVALDGGAILYNVGILLPFGIGVVIGIFAIAKLIEILLAKW